MTDRKAPDQGLKLADDGRLHTAVVVLQLVALLLTMAGGARCGR